MSTPTHPTHHTENHQNRLIALQNKSRHSVFNLALSDTPRGQNNFRISLPWSLVWRGRVSKQTTTNTKLPAITIKINIRKRQTERSNIHQISSPSDCATPDFGLRRYERELVKLILWCTFFSRALKTETWANFCLKMAWTCRRRWFPANNKSNFVSHHPDGWLIKFRLTHRQNVGSLPGGFRSILGAHS